MPREKILKILVRNILVGLAVTWLFALGCSNPVAHLPELDLKNLPGVQPTYGPMAGPFYTMVPYDIINIKYTYHPELDLKAPIPIQPDGNISLDGVGSIQAAGLTPEQLAKMIAEKSSSRLRDPQIVVTVVQYAPRKIFVGGQVKNPGVVLVQDRQGITPLQAIFDRGGFTDTAQVDSVILIRDAASANPQIGRINLHQAMEDAVPERLTLLPNDVLYVPMTGIGHAVLWVKQHLRDLIPSELFSGAYYIGAFR